MPSSRRSWYREIGNPLSVFHGRSNGRNVKWSAFRTILIGLWLGFLFHWPTEWNAWSFSALATLALATTIDTLFSMVPVSEGLAALAAIFGAVVSKRMSTSTSTTTTQTEVSPGLPAGPATPDQGEGDP